MNGQWQEIGPLNREIHLMNAVTCSETRLQKQISAPINQLAELVRREKRIECKNSKVKDKFYVKPFLN